MDMLPKNVTDIVKNLNPAVENYLKNMVQDIDIQISKAHENYEYQPLVNQTKAWTCIGIFYDYLIRKEIYNLLEEEAYDSRSSKFENDYEMEINKLESGHSISLDIFDSIADFQLIGKLVQCYQKFKDPKNATLNILEHIFNTSMLHMRFFRHTIVPFNEKMLNIDNIRSILSYIKTLELDNILINPAVGCKYFRGDADLILDDTVFDLKTSKYVFLKAGVKKMNKKLFYQLIFYALGLYVNENREIRKFKIYNPLLGYEYSMEIPELNFIEFENIVKKNKL